MNRNHANRTVAFMALALRLLHLQVWSGVSSSVFTTKREQQETLAMPEPDDMKATVRFARFRFTPFPVHTVPVHGSQRFTFIFLFFQSANIMKATVRFARFRFTPFPVHTVPIHGSHRFTLFSKIIKIIILFLFLFYSPSPSPPPHPTNFL